ncbi:MAG: site-specific DNA-methyltransferase [Deltaproteobacteria bacterium]|nr:site-specific DNA-methyltransferase [Deltaproteobacteria bacterium]
MDGKSLDLKQDKIEKLKEVIPEAFTEGKVDWEKLKAALGEDIEFKNERYVLNWAGKSDAFRVLQSPTTATLAPDRDESVNFDDTKNVFIEGENLEVLKVLQKSYFGKVKMIYIDPPYNTGNDNFIYPDRFSETKDEYLGRIGDKDEAGYMTREGLFRKNSKDSGHYHSNWLSMMYPRLFMARNLMKDDGVIFVSIDDHEVHNLRLLMNEVFGEENFVANFPRITKKAGKTSDLVSKNNDSILCFRKSDNCKFNSYTLSDEGYKYSDEYIATRGQYKLSQTLDYGSIQYSPSLDYEIEFEGEIFRPGGVTREQMKERRKRNPSSDFCWRWSKALYEFGLKKGFIVLKESKNGKRLYTKTYQNATISKNEKGYLVEEQERTKPTTTLDFIENKYSNDNSRKELDRIFDKKVFEYSKPSSIIKALSFLSTNNRDIILDFFAGSCTTAHAVLDLNKQDNGTRKFICVQLPEKCDEKSEAFKAGYKTIADIGKERIRRVIKKIKESENGKLPFAKTKQDLGFKAFKLQPSNFKIWRGDNIKDGRQLEKHMQLHLDSIKKDATEENMLFELLLKSGRNLNSTIESTNDYYRINDGEMIIALSKIDEKIVESILEDKPQVFITLDRLFKNNDQLKTNTLLQMKDAGIEFKVV